MLNLSWLSTTKDFKTYSISWQNDKNTGFDDFPLPTWSDILSVFNKIGAVKVSCQNYNSEKEKRE